MYVINTAIDIIVVIVIIVITVIIVIIIAVTVTFFRKLLFSKNRGLNLNSREMLNILKRFWHNLHITTIC
jgi:hypothetical protein